MNNDYCRWVYALTGGIGTGKSTVAALLGKCGAYVVCADDLAREAVLPRSSALNSLVARYGVEILLANGELNRERLGNVIFDDKAERTYVESVIHPVVASLTSDKFSKAIRENPEQVFVYDVPLYFEAGLDKKPFKGVILVSTPKEIAIQRAVERDCVAREQAEKRYACQIPVEEKIARATYVVDNSGSPDELRIKVNELFNKLKRS